MKSFLTPLLLFSFSLMSTTQAAPAVVGTSTSVLSSALCTRYGTCKTLATFMVNGSKRTYYNVQLKNLGNLPNVSYDVYTIEKGKKVSALIVMYPPAQEGFFDDAFRQLLYTVATGTDFSKVNADTVMACELRVRGGTTNYHITESTVVSGYAGERLLVIDDVGREDGQMFSMIPRDRKITVSTNCR